MATSMDVGASFDHNAEVNTSNVVSAVQALMREVKRGSDALADKILSSSTQIEENGMGVVASMKATQDAMLVNSKMVTDRFDMIVALDFGVRLASIDADVNKLKILVENEIVPEVKHLQGFSNRVDSLQSAINAKVEDQMSNSSAVVSAVEKQVKDIIENGNMQIPKLVNDMIDTKLVAVSNDIVKNTIQRVIAVESLVTNMSSSSGTYPQQSHSGDKSRKVLLEYTAVNNMKVMGSQGVKYKEWDEKLVNLLSQLRVGSREVMIWIKESKDKKIEKSDYEAKSFGLKYTEFNEELYSLLKEKTEGEAAEKVSQGNKGEGIEAYRR